ncbi:MAG: hypothetical protein KDK39_16130, partial [Leptospiraceae bacterium]|nr:hypothetical protein [Leptospiraceae bacterium]
MSTAPQKNDAIHPDGFHHFSFRKFNALSPESRWKKIAELAWQCLQANTLTPDQALATITPAWQHLAQLVTWQQQNLAADSGQPQQQGSELESDLKGLLKPIDRHTADHLLYAIYTRSIRNAGRGPAPFPFPGRRVASVPEPDSSDTQQLQWDIWLWNLRSAWNAG